MSKPTTEQPRRLRCAIYTRKSSEEGLDQEYNSLDAQRDAAEAYIASQKHEGWMMVPEFYDDGGFSGGNLERPALKRLLDDIRAGKIDIVVVYKVDRISRSLTDFASIVQIFDQHNVSFVSVTQNFNTTSSMGRLTLNILLSFAQFEREVIGERIRDKFAASKRKGIFMGGALPLGYRVEDRKLYVVPEEAEIVRHVFERFVAIKSITKLLKELHVAGYRTKHYTSGTGQIRGGQKMDKQYVYRILKNQLYLGKIVHKDNVYDGQHEAIISQELFEKAQKLFTESPVARGNYTRNQHPALLRGLVECTCCDCMMTPTFTKKNNRIYRYYMPTTVNRQSYADCKVGNVPASELDTLVVAHIRQMIQSPEMLTKIQGLMKEKKISDFGFEEVRQQIKNFDAFWQNLKPTEQQRITELLVKRVFVNTDEVKIDLRLDGFLTLINQHRQGDDDAVPPARGRKYPQHSDARVFQAA